MKRFFLVFSVLLLGVSYTLLLAPNASAASPYDDVINLTDNLTLTAGDSTVNVNLDWRQHFDESIQLATWMNQASKDSFSRNVPFGSYTVYTSTNWANRILLTYGDEGGQCSPTMSPFKSFKCLGPPAEPSMYTAYLEYIEPNAANGKCTYSWTTENCFRLSQVTPYLRYEYYLTQENSIFLSTFAFNYPPDYEGETVPDSYVPVNYPIPVFDWTVTQTGKLTIRYAQNLDPPPDGKFTLGIWKCAEGWKDGDPCDTQTIYENMDSTPAATAKWEGSLPPPMAGTYELPSEGNYVAIILHNCIIGKPCENRAENISFNMDWDGRTFLSGQTSSTETSTKNLQNPVWSALNNVATPTYGIQAVLQAPITFTQSLISQVGNCSSITFPKVRTLEFTFPCIGSTIKSNFGTLVTIYQTILTALVFYWVAISSLRFIKNAQKPEGDDSIKVMDL